MLKRSLRAFGPHILILILIVGAGAIVLADRYGGDAWSHAALAGMIAAIVVWGVYDFFRDDPDEPDPFGRSMLTALAHERAGRAARGRQLIWTSATVENCPPAMWEQLNSAIELGPECIAVEGELTWLAAERDWFGWPDPPRYVVVAFDAGGELVAAADFNKWPARWNRPAGLATD